MKVVILAGGFGTRLSEYTHEVPKPMVEIGGKPILWHIMNHYSKFGIDEFIIALGYKAEYIKEYFINYKMRNSDFSIDLGSGEVTNHGYKRENWKLTLVDTGINSMTGGRLKRLEKYIDSTFMMTYGDGLSNINIEKLIEFHKEKSRIATVTAVHPVARFGELEIKNDIVKSFKEKPQTKQGWINGGYFVLEPSIFKYIEDDSTVFEKEPLEELSKINQLASFKHDGYWQCMDTKRDRDALEKMANLESPPWTLI